MSVPYPQPNTQPIYPKKLFHWIGSLTVVTPYQQINASNVIEAPLLLGTAGECGGIIWQLTASVASSTALPTCWLYTRREGDSAYTPTYNILRYGGSEVGIQFGSTAFSKILPNEQKALHLEANESLYIGLSAAYATPLIINVHGGHY